jgi:Flp pilus assembly protein TadG
MPLNNALQKRSGAAAVELAVSLPVLVLLLFGTIESCTMIFLQQSLEIAAYEGARVAILPKVSETDIRATVDQILATRRVRDANVTINLLQYSDSGGSWENVDFPNHQDAPYGTFIRVDVSAPCRSNAVFNLQFFGERQLTGSVAFMKEF